MDKYVLKGKKFKYSNAKKSRLISKYLFSLQRNVSKEENEDHLKRKQDDNIEVKCDI